MQISLIAAIDKGFGVGYKNELLYKCKEDMNWFKHHTNKKVVIYGRKTLDSIGKALSHRTNVVLTRDRNYDTPNGIIVCTSVSEAISRFRHEKDVFILGGQAIYQQFIPFADKLYLTKIDHEFKADSYFPKINWNEWKEYFSQDGEDDNKYNISFHVYRRK